MSGEQLDLLISRSLDGDLSPEEQRDLETVLANDAAARRRQEEMAGLVAEARALPSPAPPFALSTRVNANVSEKAARGGSILNRFGFYPPPGMAIGAMVVLAIGAVAVTVMNPAPRRVATTIAERADGPVDVFFQDGTRAKDAAKKAAASPSESVGAKIASKEKAREEGAVARSAPAGIVESKQVASVVASNEPALDEKRHDKLADKQNKLSKSEADADADGTRTRQASVESPALSAAAPQAAGGISPAAPAAPSPAVRAMKSVETRTWSVAIRGEGAKRWMLRRAPEGRPSSSAQPSSFRVTLDAEGRVTAARALDARPAQPALLEFVRGLVFAPVASGTANAVGTVADGLVRDREQKAKDERTEPLLQKKADKNAENPAEIEVEVSAH
ncbi:MAG: hypothetical protein PT977_09250 [Acidobacteriota bacterium]|nr:hypothetical protein [Acidobacteriota bacterium]